MKVSAIKIEEDKIMMEHKVSFEQSECMSGKHAIMALFIFSINYQALEAEIIATKSVEELEKRAQEAETLKDELIRARLAEKEARQRLDTFSGTYLPYGLPASLFPSLHAISNGQSLSPAPPHLALQQQQQQPSSSASLLPYLGSSTANSTLVQPTHGGAIMTTQHVANGMGLSPAMSGPPPGYDNGHYAGNGHSHHSLPPKSHPQQTGQVYHLHNGEHVGSQQHTPRQQVHQVPSYLMNGGHNLGANGGALLSNGHTASTAGMLASAGDMEALSAEIEMERMEYVEKSRHLSEQLQQLRNEIETLKVEEKTTNLDRLHLENIQRGQDKYHTLQRIRNGTTGSRVAFFEGL